MRPQKIALVSVALSLSTWVVQGQSSQKTQSAAEASPAVSMRSFTPQEQQISAMSLSERKRLGAVPKRGMCSTAPAVRAPDGLISGNGKMFVEVYGNPFSEQVIFHHDRLIAPWKDGPMEAPEIASVLPEVKKLILDGQYRKAGEMAMAKASEGRSKPEMSNLTEHPAFDMRIDTPGQHPVHDYLRTIDFESGEVKVRWADKAGVWERKAFVSRPDNVIVQLLTAPAGLGLNAKISLDFSGVLSGRRRTADSIRVLTGREGMPPRMFDPGASEVKFDQKTDEHFVIVQGHYVVTQGNPGYATATKVLSEGGSVAADGDSLVLKDVHSLTLITRIETYDDLKQSDTDALKAAVDAITPNYDALMARHKPGQASVIDRASMDFGGASVHDMSGEEMLSDQRTRQGYNPALLENIFDMGRYWLYIHSGDYPSIWGHVNVNVNMQISPAVLGNMPEAMDTYVHWVEGLLPDSRVNAKNIFGARGALFATHPTSRGGELDHFAFGWPHHYWISAGGWVYSPIWDYYLATGDKKYLSDHVMPGLKELGQFYEDYLTETDKNGKFIFVPSYSPENWPANSEGSPAVINADMDIMVCREVFNHLIQGSETLGVNADEIPKWKAILAKMPPYLIDPDGSLKEWAWPTLEEGTSLDHRHDSHMYAVWPGDEITPETTPYLARASWLAMRKRAQGNASAHGILHRALTAARLKDPYLLNFDLKELIEMGYVNASLTTLHNPYAYPAPDPQGGIPTILMEMLVYSRPGVIGLLPALPPTLNAGTVKGLLTRTGAKIDAVTWDVKAGKLTATVTSVADQTVELQVGGGIANISATAGALVSKPAAGADSVQVKLLQGKPVTFTIALAGKDRSAWIERANQATTSFVDAAQ